MTCPWSAFSKDIVRDVMSFRAATKAKTVSSKRFVPRRVLHAATFYEGALNAARADRLDRERKKREADRKTRETRE